MKKLRVRIEATMELPEHIKLIEIDDDLEEALLMNGRLYQPDINWMRIQQMDEDGSMCSIEVGTDEGNVLCGLMESMDECSMTIVED